MRRRRTADEITRLLKEADRELAKGLTVSDFCRKHGIGQSMYYRWRQKLDPAKADTDRRCRELELEVEPEVELELEVEPEVELEPAVVVPVVVAELVELDVLVDVDVDVEVPVRTGGQVAGPQRRTLHALAATDPAFPL